MPSQMDGKKHDNGMNMQKIPTTAVLPIDQDRTLRDNSYLKAQPHLPQTTRLVVFPVIVHRLGRAALDAGV
jgi:hypothetical protein